MSGSRKDSNSHSVFAYPDSYYVSGLFDAEGFKLKTLIIAISLLVVLLVVLSVGPLSPWSAPAASSIVASTSVDTVSTMCTAQGSSPMC